MATNIAIGNYIGNRRKSIKSVLLPIARYSAKGKTNSDTDRTILKDLSGNGHDITLRNFRFSKMSGYGGYNTDFKTDWDTNESFGKIISPTKVTATYSNDTPTYLYIIRCPNIDLITFDSFKIRVSGISKLGAELVVGYEVDLFTIGNKDGIYTINKSDIVFSPTVKDFGFKIKTKVGTMIESTEIELELVPQYPDALVFDGVNNYGCNTDFTVGDDYTVICKRQWFSDTLINTGVLLAKRDDSAGVSFGEFTIEKVTADNTRFSCNSYGGSGSMYPIAMLEKNITWQTKNSYNGSNLITSNNKGTNLLLLGAGITDRELFKGVIYDLIIYNKSLTEEEIQKEIQKYSLTDPPVYLISENGDMIHTETNNLIQSE